MFFSAIPIELQNKVLTNLDGASLTRAERVCRIWREILSHVIFNSVWRRECLCNIDEGVLVEITGCENIMTCEPNSIKRTGSCTAALSGHFWKTIYKRWYIERKVGKWPVMEREIQAHEGLRN